MDLTADTGGLLFSLSSFSAVAGAVVAVAAHHPATITADAATITAAATTTVAAAAKQPQRNPL